MRTDPQVFQQLLNALSTHLDQDRVSPLLREQSDWEAALELAETTKTFLITKEGLNWSGISLPPPLEEKARAKQAACFHLNMTNIASAVRVCRILQTHGIKSACVKGVPRGFEVYGRWDLRRAGDIDLLVHPRDYREAAEVIKMNGYYTPVPSESVWWHTYLGESPYLPSTTSGPIVDLHWKLDQPGTPALSNIEQVLERAQHCAFGKHVLPTLDRKDALMLTATSIGKAIRAQEPWLREAHEIAMSLRPEAETSRECLDSHARREGVERLWKFVVRQVDRLFPTTTEARPEWDDELSSSVLGRPSPNQHAMFRTQLLWLWSDGGPLRPWRFAKELVRVRAAEYRHDVEERRREEDEASQQRAALAASR